MLCSLLRAQIVPVPGICPYARLSVRTSFRVNNACLYTTGVRMYRHTNTDNRRYGRQHIYVYIHMYTKAQTPVSTDNCFNMHRYTQAPVLQDRPVMQYEDDYAKAWKMRGCLRSFEQEIRYFGHRSAPSDCIARDMSVARLIAATQTPSFARTHDGRPSVTADS